MIRQLIVLLLVPFFVLGNSIAHSHSGAAHSSPAGGRAHIHLGGTEQGNHHHGDHGNDSHEHSHHGQHDQHDQHGQHDQHDQHDGQHAPTSPIIPADHDSDAIYLIASDYLSIATQGSSVESSLNAIVMAVDFELDKSRAPKGFEAPRTPVLFGPPLYLLHAALRL